MFAEKDVVLVAKALMEDAVAFEGYDNVISSFEGFVCEYCSGDKVLKFEDFKHTLHCPVLVAQDLLVRIS